MLNKQLLTHDKGWSSSWGLDKELTIPHHKKLARYEMFTQGLWLGQILWNYLGNGKWMSD